MMVEGLQELARNGTIFRQRPGENTSNLATGGSYNAIQHYKKANTKLLPGQADSELHKILASVIHLNLKIGGSIDESVTVTLDDIERYISGDGDDAWMQNILELGWEEGTKKFFQNLHSAIISDQFQPAATSLHAGTFQQDWMIDPLVTPRGWAASEARYHNNNNGGGHGLGYVGGHGGGGGGYVGGGGGGGGGFVGGGGGGGFGGGGGRFRIAD